MSVRALSSIPLFTTKSLWIFGAPASALATRALGAVHARVSAFHSRADRGGMHRLRSIVLIDVPWKLPFESGPKSTESPARTVPALRIPSTTVPTYGTEYTSVIEYCGEQGHHACQTR